MNRPWLYNGYTIESNPNGVRFKYVVWLSRTRLVAGTTLAEVMADLDRLTVEAVA